jgi:NADP-dependent 3-hydroxy acid dehydrogenase YdfG
VTEFSTTTRREADVVIDITESRADNVAGAAPPDEETSSGPTSPSPARESFRTSGDRPLTGRLAVVTGGTGRVGRAVTANLIAAGAKVCIIGRDLPRLRQAVSDAGDDAALMFLQCDLGSATEIEGLTDFIDRFDRPIDILVHTAGVDVKASVATGLIDDLDEQYLVNLRGPYLLTQKLLGKLVAAQGHVVFVNSDAGLVARVGDAQRAITRFGLRGLADALRQEVKALGVRVTSVYPPSALEAGGALGATDIAASVVHALTLPASVEVTDISLGSSTS